LFVPSSIVIVTSIASLLGFAINILMISTILLSGQRYNILFALLLLVASSWDIGIFQVMIRNDFPSARAIEWIFAKKKIEF
jgi:hypothetical protein